MAASNENERAKLAAAAIATAAALLLTAWLLGFFDRDDRVSDDPQVADLQRAMQQPGKADTKLLVQKYQQMTPAQQQEIDVRKMLMGLREHEQKLNDFFAQPEAEQWKQIDREIEAKEAKLAFADAGAQKKGNRPSGGKATAERIMAGKQAWTANASPELRSMMERRLRMIEQRSKQRRQQRR